MDVPNLQLATSPGDDPLYDNIFTYTEGGEQRETNFAGALLDFARVVLESGAESLSSAKKTQRKLLLNLMAMYWLSLVVGFGAFGMAVHKGLSGQDVGVTAVFGGLSAAIVIAFFILRPTAGVERAGIAATITNLVANSYWMRMAFSVQKNANRSASKEQDRRLEDATTDAVKHLTRLATAASKSEKEYLTLLQQEAEANRRPELTLDAPTSPAKLKADRGSTLSGIKVAVTPAGHALTWNIQGDDDGRLVQVKLNEFEYSRGSSAANEVRLTFASVEHPNRAAHLDVVKDTA